MRVMVLLLALSCAFALAAENAAVAPRPAASQKPQTAASLKPQATSLGTESITIPQMLSYQGKLTDTLGQPVPNGNYQLTFRLYTVPTGGTAFWTEGQTVLVKSGLFSALLGAVTPITSLPDSGGLYLGLQVAVDPELSPRLRIASAAYAYKADTANYALASAGGGTVISVAQGTGVVCSPNPITFTGTVLFDSTWGDGRYERVANKNVASGYCGLDASTKVPNGRLYTGTGNGLDADLLDGSHAAAFAPSSGSANYIQNQNSSGQAASFRVTGTGQAAQFHGVSTTSGVNAIVGEGGTYASGVYGSSATGGYGLSGVNTYTGGTAIFCAGNNISGLVINGGSGLAASGSKFGVFGYGSRTDSSAGGYFYNGHGDFAYVAYYNGTAYKINGGGAVSTIMATREGRKNLFAPEMPEAYFEDCGEGQLANGHCRVSLEELFSDCITVNAEHPLRVFVQLEDDCKGVYVNKDATGFDVRELQGGTSNAHFSWRVLAKWKGNENVRLPEAPGPLPTTAVEKQVPVEGKTTTATQPQPVPGRK